MDMKSHWIATEDPLQVGDRPGWKTINVVIDIQKVSIGNEVFDFESEHGFSLSSDAPRKDIFFHSDAHSEDELVFFGLELKNNYIHLLPGNSNVDGVCIDQAISACSSKPIQHKQRA